MPRRRSLAERYNIADEFCKMLLCCLHQANARVIHSLLRAENNGQPPTALQLMSTPWQLKLAHGVSEFDTGTSDIEDRHHHCAQMAPAGSSVELMSARYVLAEAETLYETYHTPLESRIFEKEPTVTPPLSCNRFVSPIILFHCKLSRDNMARHSQGYAPQPNYFR